MTSRVYDERGALAVDGDLDDIGMSGSYGTDLHDAPNAVSFILFGFVRGFVLFICCEADLSFGAVGCSYEVVFLSAKSARLASGWTAAWRMGSIVRRAVLTFLAAWSWTCGCTSVDTVTSSESYSCYGLSRLRFDGATGFPGLFIPQRRLDQCLQIRVLGQSFLS